MRFDSLQQWLDWQPLSHVMEMGLERVAEVARRLAITDIAETVITVAGTNGKGSTVASYETWLHNAGYTVASYTSPHLLHYNERIKLNRQPASDQAICEAFETIDQVRDDMVLTYFEFGTLAALWLIQRLHPDYAILEVGMGGRLDAVNIIDADLVHLTSIDIDHQNWLGHDREAIGFEKAGVLRKGIPVICNDTDLPQSVQSEITRLDCQAQQYQCDFTWQVGDRPGQYRWQQDDLSLMLEPVLPGDYQLQNLAGVVAGLHQLLDLNHYQAGMIQQYFSGTSHPGRFQQLDLPTNATVYVDVGHNQSAARALAASLATIKKPQSRITVILGMLETKDSAAFVKALKHIVDTWWLLSLNTDGGLSATRLAERVKTEIQPAQIIETVGEALDRVASSAERDIILITGSFVTVEQCLLALSNRDVK